jgi:GH24 family phage-related lysozyme (muramidase)
LKAAVLDPRLERDIGVAEADKLTAYRDSLGFWTIGRGHLLTPQDHDWSGYTITPEQDEAYFDADIQQAIAFAHRLPEWKSCDTDCRRNALIELCFNMRGKWLKFIKTREAMERGDWQAAHDELLNSEWAAEVHLSRANRLANYLLTGEYP